MYTYETKESCEKATQAAIDLLLEKFKQKDLIIRSLRIGFALTSANEPTRVIIAGFLRDVVRRECITYQDIYPSFGFPVMDYIRKCESIDRYYNMSAKQLRGQLIGDSEYQDYIIPIMVAEVTEDLTHIKKFCPAGQEELMAWAKSWHKNAQAFSSPGNLLTVALGREIECAKDTILDTTLIKGVQQCFTQIPIEQ